MRSLLSAAIFFALAGALLAESEATDAILARTSDYCVLGVSDGKRLIVRELIFGNAGWQQLRSDYRLALPGRRALDRLSFADLRQHGRARSEANPGRPGRGRERGRFGRFLCQKFELHSRAICKRCRASCRPTFAPCNRSRPGLGQNGRKPRRRRFESMLTPQSTDRMAEYERINRLVSSVVQDLHADDIPTLQQMARLILRRPKVIRENVRGEFAVAIAQNYFRPGFDAVRDVAFENSDAWSAEGAALGSLGRVGNRHDLERMKAEAEGIMAAGVNRQVRYSLFRAMGELAAHSYPEGSPKREELRKWFERMCAHPTPEERKMDGQNLAATALHFIGNAETKALLESLQRQDPAMRGVFSWAIRDIEARLRGEW